MSKKNWKRKECDGCKYYNPECRQGACSLYTYKNEKVVSEKEDTGLKPNIFNL